MQPSYHVKTPPFLLSILFLFVTITAIAQVGIGTTTPKPSAALEVSSANKGFLPPQITRSQRDAISSPAAGLMLWCSDCGTYGEMQVYNGSAWTNMAGAAPAAQNSVVIGTQEWRTKNLDVSAYRDGTPIPQVTDGDVWNSTNTGAWCWYNNDSVTYAATYGKLYNWYAVNDSRGLAPAGWHVPSDAEWTTLGAFLGGASVAGGKLKEADLAHWISPNTGATNSSGFTALPGGYRFNGSFGSVSTYGQFWSSTGDNQGNAWVRSLIYNNSNLLRDFLSHSTALSVRVMKD